GRGRGDLWRGVFPCAPAGLADREWGVRLVVGFEESEGVDEARSDDRITADSNAGRLPHLRARELPYHFVRERSAPAHEPDPPGRMDEAGHDADLGLSGRDEARAVGSDQTGVPSP